LSIDAPAAQAARAVVRQDGFSSEHALQLREGVQQHDVAFVPRREGAVVADVELLAADGGSLVRERCALWVGGRLRVLLLAPHDGSAWRTTLVPLGIDVQRHDPEQVLDREALLPFDAVVVDDLAADRWPQASQEAVRDAVQDGLGLLLGGLRSNLGPGGYATSPLQRVLPVDMPRREERRDPSVALVIILDTSGSMGGARIELAKEVARLALQRLLPHDKVGIVEFHGSKRWAAPLQAASNQIDVQRALNRLQAGGGTIIYEALEEGYYALRNVQTRFKHLLVLTDGGVESGPFEALARRIAESGMNLSTVLIGPQGNSPFLVDLAQWGRGRFYACPSRFQMPDLRFKEPQAAPLPAVQNELEVRRQGLHEVTQALAGLGLPVSGLVEARPRPGASVLAAAGGRPYVAGWDQGLGHVLVVAGELLPERQPELTALRPYGAFLHDALRMLARGKEAALPQVACDAYGSGLRVRLTGVPSSPRLPALRIEGGREQAFAEVAAGRHEAWLDWAGSEPLVFDVESDRTRQRAAAIIPLARGGADCSEVLRGLAAATAAASAPPAASVESLARPLALCALVAFLLFLLVRRWPVAAGVLLLSALLPPAPAQDPVEAAQVLLERGERGPGEAALRAVIEGEKDATRRAELAHLAAGYRLFELALEHHHPLPDRPAMTTHLRRAAWSEAAGRAEVARAELELALAAARLQRDRRFVLASLVALARRQDDLPQFSQWLQQRMPEPQFAHAWLLVQRERGEAGELLAFARAHSGDKELVAQALQIAVECGAAEQAVTLAREQLARSPDDVALRTTLSLLLADRRDQAGATAALTEGLARASGPAAVRLTQAAVDLSLPEAVEAGVRQLRGSEDPELRLQGALLEAQALRREQRLQDAVLVLEAAAKDLADPGQRARIGEELESLGRREQAIAFYRQAFQQSQAEDLALRLAWLLAASSSPEQRAEAHALMRFVWLNAGSPGRRAQVEERMLDQSARDGTLADLVLELEAALRDQSTERREIKRQALVRIYSRSRDTVGAAIVLREWAAQEPERALDAWLELARMHLENREYRAFGRAIARLIELDPQHELDYHQQLAASAFERGRPAEARALVKELLQREDLSDVAFEFAGGIANLAGRPDEAAAIYARALQKYPERIETWLLRGGALRAAGQTQVAIDEFEALLRQQPRDDLLLVAADGLLNVGAPADALRLAERALRRRISQSPDRVHLHRMLQDLCEALGDEESRQRALAETVLVAGEQRAAYVREQMEDHKRRGDWAAYVRAGQDLLFLGDEAPPAVFVELGEAHLRAGQWKAAERAFERARLSPEFHAIERRISAAYEEAGLVADAERVARAALRRTPQEPSALLQVARLAERRGARGEALLLYRDAALRLQAGPRRPGGTVRVLPGGRHQTESGPRFDEAGDGVLRNARARDDIAPLAAELAQHLARTEDGEDRITALGWLRRLWSAAGPDGAAAIAAVEADELARGGPDVARAIAEARLRAGDLDGALQALQRAPLLAFDRVRFQIALLQRDVERAQAMLATGRPAELAEAALQFQRLGFSDQAQALLARLRALAAERPEQAAAAWRRAARGLGQSGDDPELATRQLEEALRQREPARRLTATLAVLRQEKCLREPRAAALRQVLPDALADPTGNQAFAFAQAALGLLTPEELAPVIQKSLANLSNPYLLFSRLEPLRVLPPAQQVQILDAAMRGMEPGEQVTQTLRLIATTAEIGTELRRRLIEGLQLRRLGTADRNWFQRICEEIDWPPDLGALLLERFAPLGDDPRVHVLRARLLPPAEREASWRRAAAAFARRQQLESGDLQTASRLAALLPAGARDWPELQAETAGARALRAETVRRAGDLRGAAQLWDRVLAAQPGDVTISSHLQALYDALGDRAGKLAALQRHVQSLPQVYPYQAQQIAQALLEEDRAEEALATLLRSRDTGGSTLSTQLEAIVRLADAGQRGRELRRWLQQKLALGRSLRIATLREAGEASLEAALQAPVPALPWPRGREPWRRGMADADLLASIPEGEELARIWLQSLDENAADQAPLWRVIVGAAWRDGRAPAVLQEATARLATAPYDARALATVQAAAELGLDVPAELFERICARRLLEGSGPALADLLVLAHERKAASAVSRLLAVLLQERATLQSLDEERLQSVCAIAAAVMPERLLALAPDAAPVPLLDGCLLQALGAVQPPATVRAAFAAVERQLAQPGRAASERLLLPWCGLLLRAGDLAGALASLLALEPRTADAFPAKALGAAIPPLPAFRDPAHVARLADTLLAQAHAGTPRGTVCFRFAVVLAARLRAANDPRGAELLRALATRTASSPAAQRWLEDAGKLP
jgi:predicted Zn-dependent protease